MIEYYIYLVNKYGKNGFLNGYFLKGVAIVNKDTTYTSVCKASRCFSNKKSEVIDDGYPLASIQIISSLVLMLNSNCVFRKLNMLDKYQFLVGYKNSKIFINTVIILD